MAPVCFSIAKFDVKWVSQPSRNVRKFYRKRLCISSWCFSPWSRVQSRENCVFQFPSKSLLKKIGNRTRSSAFGACVRCCCSSLTALSWRHDSFREPLAGALPSVCVFVCVPGVSHQQPATHTLAVSSECVVSIRLLLLLLLCQGKSGDSRFFFSLILFELLLDFTTQRRRWWHCLSDVSLK